MRTLTLLFALISVGSSFLLVPEDVVSFLNAFYSRFPPIRIGMNNTKVGLGFRMGRNVDVQFLVELGPQDARPTDSSKREAPTRPHALTTAGNPLTTAQNRRPAVKTPLTTAGNRWPSRSPATTEGPRVVLPADFINILRRRRPGKTAPTTTITTTTELDVKENEIDSEN